MAVLKRCVCSSQSKYIMANVVDRNNGNIVEHALKNTLMCNAKAADVVREVLAMRLKVEGLEDGIHVDVDKEIERIGFQSHNKVWAVVNAMKNNGVMLVLEDEERNKTSCLLWSRKLVLMMMQFCSILDLSSAMICVGENVSDSGVLLPQWLERYLHLRILAVWVDGTPKLNSSQKQSSCG